MDKSIQKKDIYIIVREIGDCKSQLALTRLRWLFYTNFVLKYLGSCILFWEKQHS